MSSKFQLWRQSWNFDDIAHQVVAIEIGLQNHPVDDRINLK
jgi:hypothetical protein